ncbi:MAG: MarC family protein [Chthonomonadales bacterium]
MHLEGGFLKTVIALLVITDPVGAIPVFILLTQAHTNRERNRAARTAACAVVVVLLAAAVGGEFVLKLFGISLLSFRVAGGLLFVVMALDMLNARPSRSRQTPEETEEAEHRPDIAVVPLAIPMLAGPGAIGMIILFAHAGPFWPHILHVVAVIAIVGTVVYTALRLAAPIGKALGTTGMHILVRVMGLILASVGVEFIVGGLRSMWAGG